MKKCINKNRMPEEVQRKADVTKNAEGLDDYIEAQRDRERNLYPLRINSTTVIYVTKGNCTEAYAEKFRKKIGGMKQ